MRMVFKLLACLSPLTRALNRRELIFPWVAVTPLPRCAGFHAVRQCFPMPLSQGTWKATGESSFIGIAAMGPLVVSDLHLSFKGELLLYSLDAYNSLSIFGSSIVDIELAHKNSFGVTVREPLMVDLTGGRCEYQYAGAYSTVVCASGIEWGTHTKLVASTGDIVGSRDNSFYYEGSQVSKTVATLCMSDGTVAQMVSFVYESVWINGQRYDQPFE